MTRKKITCQKENWSKYGSQFGLVVPKRVPRQLLQKEVCLVVVGRRRLRLEKVFSLLVYRMDRSDATPRRKEHVAETELAMSIDRRPLFLPA